MRIGVFRFAYVSCFSKSENIVRLAKAIPLESHLFYSLGYETVSKIISNEDLDASVSVVLKEAPVSLEQVVLISKIDAFSQWSK